MINNRLTPINKRALMIIDMQYDFVSKTGSLYVKDAEHIIEPINLLINNLKWDQIIFTQDWHPIDHVSFDIFPQHCVHDTPGAIIVDELQITDHLIPHFIFKKGYNKYADSLSAFIDSTGTNTGLDSILRKMCIDTIYIVGVALDYCVKETAIDAKKLGFNVNVIIPYTKSVTTNGYTETINLFYKNKINMITKYNNVCNQ